MNTTTRLTQRSIVPLALALVLALSACGSDATSGSGLLPPTPVRVTGSGGGADGAATSLAAGESVAADDMGRLGMYAPWIVYEFSLAGSMPALPTEANGWQYAPNPTVDLGRVAQLAAALGVVGEPVARAADQGGGWIVGPDDGSAASLYVSADAQVNWWYNAPYSSEGVVSEECVRSVEAAPAEEGGSSDGSAGSSSSSDELVAPEDCVFETPEPPTGILDADEARARATDLLRQMGEDPAQFEFEVYADEWYASVSALQRLGNLTSPVGWYFGFGAEGRLDYAGGVLSRPQEVGPYPLVDIETAVARLTNGYFGGIMPYATDTVSLGAPDLLCEEGTDCQPATEPETVQVTLTGLEQELWWAWDTDGTVWLLPAFTFLDADGGRYTVPAVTDEYLIIDDVLVDPAVSEPAPAPGDGVAVAQGDADILLGQSEDEALDTAAALGWEIRVVERDGEGFAVTDDYRANRVNVTITGGTVSAVAVG